MSGWGQGGGFTGDVTPAPLVGWELPVSVPGLSVREALGSTWRLYRHRARTLVALSAITQAAAALTSIPSLIIATRSFEAMISVFRDLDVRSLGEDPDASLAFQARLQAAGRPEPDLLLLLGVASALAVLVSLIGLGLQTAAALDVVDGYQPTIGRAFRAVSLRAGAFVVPGIVIALGSFLITVVPQSFTPTTDPASYASRQAVVAVVGVLVLVVEIAAVVLAVRWCLAIPAILSEGLGLRAGLSRSAALTHGIRLRLALTFFVFGVIVGIVTAVVVIGAGAVIGIATKSLLGFIGTLAITSFVASVVLAPLGAVLISHLYRLRAPLVVDAAESAPGPDVTGAADDGAAIERSETPEPPESSPTPEPPALG
jgi:hypothetical protein